VKVHRTDAPPRDTLVDHAAAGGWMPVTAEPDPASGEEPSAGGAWPLATGRVPLLYWLRRYQRPWLGRDLAAAAAVTALIVPKNLGYAEIAGIPVQNGLYAAAAGAILYAIFCTSRHISTGPSSSLAAVAGGAVAVSGVDAAQAPELVAAIAIGMGLLFLLLAVLRLGWIARFLSRPVVVGFLAGAAIQVVIGELPKLTGSPAEGDNSWRELRSWIEHLDQIHWTTLAVGAVALGVILGLRFTVPAVPGALVLLAGGLLASWLLDLGAHGVKLVGDVPRGLPDPAVPSVDLVHDHLALIGVASFALLLIGFSQTAGDARAFAVRHRYRVDIDQESVAQGMANVGAGFLQGMPVTTSLSASSLNEASGARTPVATLGAGVLVVGTLILLAPVFSDLPKAVLAAIIIDAVVFGMIDLGAFRRLRRVARFDFWIAVIAVLAVLSVGVLAGAMVGMALSLGWLVYVASSPGVPELGREPGRQVFRDLDAHPDGETLPGVIVLRLDGALFFATADALESRVRDRAERAERLDLVILDLVAVDFLDADGSGALARVQELVADHGARLRLAHVKPAVAAVLERDGLLDAIGTGYVHGDIEQALLAEQALRRG
jgi:SulP family sulfate permease